MTTPEAILSTLLSRGVQLWVSGEDIRYRSPAGILTPELLNEVRKYKPELISLLKNSSTSPAHLPVSPATLQHPSEQNPEHATPTEVRCINEAGAAVAGGQNAPATPANTSDSPLESRSSMAAARLRLEEVTNEVAHIWNGLPAPAGDRPWLDQAIEEKLDNAITDRFRAEDLPGAMAAIENWRLAWLAILPHPSVPAGKATLAIAEPARRLDTEKLFDLVHDPATPESDREVYTAEVHRRARAMVEESDGRRPTRRPHARELFQLKDIPGLSDAELLRRLNNPKVSNREWQGYAHAAAARGLVGHAAPAHAGGFRPHPFVPCSPENPAQGHRQWRSVHGAVVCGYCHPPASPELVAEWLPAQPGKIEAQPNTDTTPEEPEGRYPTSAAGNQDQKQLTGGPAGKQKGNA